MSWKWWGLVLWVGLGLGGAAWPNPVEEYPGLDLPSRYLVVVKGREVPVTWKDDRPFVTRSDVAPLLNLSFSGDPSLDLFKLLKSKNYRVTLDGQGTLVCSPSSQPPAPGGAPPAGLPAAPAPTGPARTSDFSRSAQARLGRALDLGTHQLAQGRAAEQQQLERLGASLVSASHRNVPWSFYIVDDPSPNAFSTGEGVVAVTTGLLNLHLTQDELAGVLAHEIAHGTRQHAEAATVDAGIRQQALRDLEDAQRLQQRYQQEYQREVQGQDQGSQGISMARSSYESKMVTVRRRISDAQKKVDYLAGRQRFATEISQEQEIEADATGMRYAATAGYAPEGLMAALAKLEATQIQKFGYSYNAQGQTHPPTSRRIEILRKVLASWRRS